MGKVRVKKTRRVTSIRRPKGFTQKHRHAEHLLVIFTAVTVAFFLIYNAMY